MIPLLSVVGKALIVAPEQNGPTAVNTGVAFGVIVTVIVVVTAHCPASGVKVYVVVVVLLNAGDHVPVMPFVEVVGKLNTSCTQWCHSRKRWSYNWIYSNGNWRYD